MQLEYSLVARDVESEHIAAALEAGMAIVPWSPLAGGFLTGKYERGASGHKGRLSGPNPFGNSKFSERNWGILEVLKEVALELDRPPARVALAWVLAQPGVASVLVGAISLGQIESNIAALRLVLRSDQKARLQQASAPPATFTSGLASPMIRKMVFGGHTVSGWCEEKITSNL